MNSGRRGIFICSDMTCVWADFTVPSMMKRLIAFTFDEKSEDMAPVIEQKTAAQLLAELRSSVKRTMKYCIGFGHAICLWRTCSCPYESRVRCEILCVPCFWYVEWIILPRRNEAYGMKNACYHMCVPERTVHRPTVSHSLCLQISTRRLLRPLLLLLGGRIVLKTHSKRREQGISVS